VGLRIAEHAGNTDVGRQRDTNEDALVMTPPLFAVADGMGGARAGEVASQLATEAFSAGDSESAPPEQRLADTARDANRRIYELASQDESLRGMGTTLTAALVADREVSIGHVGDSRAYRLRDGQLEQLTKDHSLVAELERSGQISPEAAEHHPQRSIITRALGPEPDVEVDTYTIPGRAGDVYLLCSDGLTSMVSDDEMGALIRGASSLSEAAEGLVRSANQSGGKDNITVVLFRLDEDEAAPEAGETIAGALTADDVQQEAARVESPVPSPQSPGTATARGRPAAVAGRKRRRGGRLVLRGLVTLLAVGAVVAGLYALSRQVYFLGTDDAGLVALYRGVPYELPFGMELYEEEYQSGVPARAIPRRRRGRVLNHEWRGREDAVDLVRQLERGRLDRGFAR
jgi:PPM family protein phosphatase